MDRSDKKSFLVHLDLLNCIEMMTDEEAGMMLRAIKAYWTETEYDLPRELQFAFLPVKQAFDRDWLAYIDKVNTNRENGKKGGRPKLTEETQGNPKKPNGYLDNPKNPDKDNEKDNGNEKDINTMSDKSDDARKALEYLNEETNQNFRMVETNLKLLRDRIKSGASLVDIKLVIDKKRQEWQGSDMEKYLRPKTLFSATNFEQYLGEKQNGKSARGSQNLSGAAKRAASFHENLKLYAEGGATAVMDRKNIR